MKRIMLCVALALPAFAQQTLDFSLLDKLGANASSKNNITLDGDTLKLGSAFLGDRTDAHPVKKLVENLRGIYIRSFEYEKPGQYNETDLESFRASLKQQKWSRIVESREKQEVSEIFVQAAADRKFAGMVIVSAEPKEVTVVWINGPLNLDDLSQLGGNLGIPEINLDRNSQKAPAKKEE